VGRRDERRDEVDPRFERPPIAPQHGQHLLFRGLDDDHRTVDRDDHDGQEENPDEFHPVDRTEKEQNQPEARQRGRDSTG
jgi:hypothetical protein